MHNLEDSQQEIRQILRSLPQQQMPADLRRRIQIAASRESAKRRRWTQTPEWFYRLQAAFQLWSANMMRPLALPCAGGLTATVLIFSMFIHTYPVRANSLNNDIPTALYTPPSARTTPPFESSVADVEIEVSITEQGRFAGYEIVAGSQAWSPEVQRSVARTLLFVEFTPATSFGQPVASVMRISLRKGDSNITVKG